MTPQALAKRREVMRRSIALGHCICDVRQACPCEEFKQQAVCHCAGELPERPLGPVKLTSLVRNAGCASKVPKHILQQVLGGIETAADARVLVGAADGDDAGVMLLTPDVATIFTVDVFCPCVDDPYLFGQIAAANSLSDIYAMGGQPQAALSIMGFPLRHLPAEVMGDILRGGAARMREAGVPIIGGHTLQDDELKCGYAVLGTSPARGFVTNAGAQVGDVLVLSKPLGSGIIAFAQQLGLASPESVEAMGIAAAQLNRMAGAAMVRCGAHAATDITGFGFAGHVAEMARRAGVLVRIDAAKLPLLPQVRTLVERGVLSGAVERNRESVDAALLDPRTLAPWVSGILFGPETSGGILAALPPADVDAYVKALADEGVSAWCVGAVVDRCAGGRIEVVGDRDIVQSQEAVMDQTQTTACCEHAGNGQVAAPAGLPAPVGAEAFRTYMATVNAEGALPAVTKKLMSFALSVATKCEPCVAINAKAARELGASDAQLAEAAALGIAFGGASAAMFYQRVRADKV